MHVALASASGLAEMDQDEEVLAEALVPLGVTTSIEMWDDPNVAWGDADGVVIRSAWDYTARRDEFMAWATQVEAVTPLWNPSDVVRWNSHKGYLLELEDRGVPIVPTAWLAAGDTADLATLAAARGWRDVVVKPCIGAGAEGLLRIRGDLTEGQDAFGRLVSTADVMVQPFLPRLPVEGELSVVVIDGTVSHAVRKQAAPGDIRIQIEFGGTYTPEETDTDTARLAEWIVESCGQDLLYARVDLVPDDDGSWMLGELEAVEPALYLEWAPDRGAALASALVARLGATSST